MKKNCVTCAKCGFASACKAYLFDYQERLFVDSLSTRKAFAKGDFIYRCGNKVDALYALRSGFAKVYDAEDKLQGLILPGQVFGAEELYSEYYQHHVQAASPVEVCQLKNSRFYEISQITTGFTNFIIKIIARSALEKQKFIAVLNQRDNAGKVLGFLRYLSDINKEYGLDQCEIQLPLNQEEIAHMLGISKSTFLRAMDMLVDQELVDIKNKTMMLLASDSSR
ncbi:Crp/Fnr family transcriptional regulator [Mangrovibacter sp. MFB070]|uniref:Crp/Fnr family transcriptional regulator n=1 Tax=Mangrovibacter sp. MFB070 TaxID=1224318 RepID=UPI0004D5630F|nr:Crp/Fnr family transcriptional regulator [Mangrovibacter sp. MFB070]KEA53380.1 Crp/Fnr family transcriptional regulator [Mangrovibacter sp. MFB070]